MACTYQSLKISIGSWFLANKPPCLVAPSELPIACCLQYIPLSQKTPFFFIQSTFWLIHVDSIHVFVSFLISCFLNLFFDICLTIPGFAYQNLTCNGNHQFWRFPLAAGKGCSGHWLCTREPSVSYNLAVATHFCRRWPPGWWCRKRAAQQRDYTKMKNMGYSHPILLRDTEFHTITNTKITHTHGRSWDFTLHDQGEKNETNAIYGWPPCDWSGGHGGWLRL